MIVITTVPMIRMLHITSSGFGMVVIIDIRLREEIKLCREAIIFVASQLMEKYREMQMELQFSDN